MIDYSNLSADFAWKTKKNKHQNMKFLPIFQVFGTKMFQIVIVCSKEFFRNVIQPITTN